MHIPVELIRPATVIALTTAEAAVAAGLPAVAQVKAVCGDVMGCAGM